MKYHVQPTGREKLMRENDFIVSKTDLKAAVGFDEAFFRQGLASASPDCALFPVNSLTGDGVDAFVSWLREARAR